MTLVVAPLLLSLTLAAGLEQTKPDFSGKWTKIPTSPGEAVATMIISQTADTLTVETQSADGVVRSVQKLDGSESRNVIKQAKPPIETVRVSTTTWDGDSLVTRIPIPEYHPAPIVFTTVTRLEGATLVIQVTQTSEATGAVQNQHTFRYSK
jgi:hypothetical protein